MVEASNTSDDMMAMPKSKQYVDDVSMVSRDKSATGHDNGDSQTVYILSNKNKIRLLFFFAKFSTGSMNPFMSLYMQHTGLDADQIGALQAVRPIVTMLSAPIWGGLADRTGRKKLVLMFTFTMSFLLRLCTNIFAGNLQSFAATLFASSIFYAPVMSLLDSIVVSSLSEHDKVNFGKLRLWGELGNGLASTIIIHIINRGNGFDYMFILHGISSIIALVCMSYCVPTYEYETIHKKSKSLQTAPNKARWKEGLRVIFSDVQILSVFCLVVITGYSMAVLENFCYMNIRHIYATHGSMEVAGRDISLYRVCYSLGGTLTWWFCGSWTKRLGPDAVMFASVCSLSLCFFLYAGVSSELDILTKVGFLVSEAIRSGVFAALWSNATLRLNKLSPHQVQSVMQTMLEATYRGIGHTSGSYMGGKLCKSREISEAFLLVGKFLTSFLSLVGAVAFWKSTKIVLRDDVKKIT